MNKQVKPKKFVTVRLDAELIRALEKDYGGVEAALNKFVSAHTPHDRASLGKKISKKVADSQSAFLEKYGSLSDEFGTL